MKTLDINSRFQKSTAPEIDELVGEQMEKAFDVDECEDDGTQIVKWHVGKVTAVRRSKEAWVEWDNENERNDWEKLHGKNVQTEVGKKNTFAKS